MRSSRRLLLLALLILPALHGHAQWAGLPPLLARLMGENGLNLNVSRSTPAGSVTLRANLSSSGGSYSATVTAPSGSSMSVSGTATNVSAGGGSFSGTITSSAGPSASYAGSVAVSSHSIDADASATPADEAPEAAPQPPAQISLRVSAPAGNGTAGASFSGTVTPPQGAPATYDGAVAITASSVDVSTSFTATSGTTISRTVSITPPEPNSPAGTSADSEETPLQKLLRKLGVIRSRG